MELERKYPLEIDDLSMRPSRHLLSTAYLFFGMFMQNALADDSLPETGLAQIEFLVTDHLSQPKVEVSVTFDAEGMRKLRADGRVLINGQVVEPTRLQKQGYWYHTQVQRAARYELAFKRSAVSPERRVTIEAKHFAIPAIPATISKREGLKIKYDGDVLTRADTAFAQLDFPHSPGQTDKWGFALVGKVSEKEMFFSPSALQEVRTGTANLQIGAIYSPPSGQQDISLVFAINQQAQVNVVN